MWGYPVLYFFSFKKLSQLRGAEPATRHWASYVALSQQRGNGESVLYGTPGTDGFWTEKKNAKKLSQLHALEPAHQLGMPSSSRPIHIIYSFLSFHIRSPAQRDVAGSIFSRFFFSFSPNWHVGFLFLVLYPLRLLPPPPLPPSSVLPSLLPPVTVTLTHSLPHSLTHTHTLTLTLTYAYHPHVITYITNCLLHSVHISLTHCQSDTPVIICTYIHTHKLTHHHPSITLILPLPFFGQKKLSQLDVIELERCVWASALLLR